jgi:hypothetical protein
LNEIHTMQKDDGPNEFHKLPADFDEGLEKEGNAFTAGLAKTKKGGEFEVGGKKFKDRTNYDASLGENTENFLDQVYDILNDTMRANELSPEAFDRAAKYLEKHGEQLTKVGQPAQEVADAIIRRVQGLDEYQFDQMYPDDPGPFENKDVDDMIKEFLVREDDVNWDRMDDEEAEENETDNGIEEDINLPSSQPTGPSIEETRRPLSHLSPEERDQLRQYVETIKTVKEEINKMINKSGMKEGGNMTNLIMRPNTGNIRK